MVVAEIAAGAQSLRAALDIAKAMIGLRDAEAFRAKSIELQTVILEGLERAIEARETYTAQADRIRDLEAEVARLKAWDAERQNYELKKIGRGVVAYMLKPEARGAEPPHWLCPDCYAKGEKAYFQATGTNIQRNRIFKCIRCSTVIATEDYPTWQDHADGDD